LWWLILHRLKTIHCRRFVAVNHLTKRMTACRIIWPTTTLFESLEVTNLTKSLGDVASGDDTTANLPTTSRTTLTRGANLVERDATVPSVGRLNARVIDHTNITVTGVCIQCCLIVDKCSPLNNTHTCAYSFALWIRFYSIRSGRVCWQMTSTIL
jgi:hypothetical protein